MIDLDPATGALLLRLARASIREALLDDGALVRLREATALPPQVEVPHGAFVTLTEPGVGPGPRPLRGCIGCTVSPAPLHECVCDLALRAAFEDPRFTPLAAGELPRVRIEISVLGPLSPLDDPQAIEVGRHGVQLGRGSTSAVFLPQVALEHRWDAAQLLEQLARKAGLPHGGWREARLQVFEAQVFGESEPAG